MKRLTYVMPYPESMTGISAKFNAQLDALRGSFVVSVVHLVPETKNRMLRIIGRLPHQLWVGFSLLFRNTVIYYRYCPLDFIFNILLFFCGSKIVWVELNTCYREELKSEHWVHMALHRLSMFFLKKSKVTFLPVTGEIAALETLPEGRWAALPNGINKPPLFPVVPSSQRAEEIVSKLRGIQRDSKKILVFSASRVERWHGFDRVSQLCSMLDNTYLAVFGELTTPPHEFNELEKEGLAACFGKVTPDELDFIYSACDFGVASFGFDRINLNEACPLKVRGYWAAGLRVIGNYFDTAMNDAWVRPHFFQFKEGEVHALQCYIDTPYDHIELRGMAKTELSWYTIFNKAKVI